MNGRHAAYPIEYLPRHCDCAACSLEAFHFQHVVETSAIYESHRIGRVDA